MAAREALTKATGTTGLLLIMLKSVGL